MTQEPDDILRAIVMKDCGVTMILSVGERFGGATMILSPGKEDDLDKKQCRGLRNR